MSSSHFPICALTTGRFRVDEGESLSRGSAGRARLRWGLKRGGGVVIVVILGGVYQQASPPVLSA